MTIEAEVAAVSGLQVLSSPSVANDCGEELSETTSSGMCLQEMARLQLQLAQNKKPTYFSHSLTHNPRHGWLGCHDGSITNHTTPPPSSSATCNSVKMLHPVHSLRLSFQDLLCSPCLPPPLTSPLESLSWCVTSPNYVFHVSQLIKVVLCGRYMQLC